jgi:hypothetical protein
MAVCHHNELASKVRLCMSRRRGGASSPESPLIGTCLRRPKRPERCATRVGAYSLEWGHPESLFHGRYGAPQLPSFAKSRCAYDIDSS